MQESENYEYMNDGDTPLSSTSVGNEEFTEPLRIKDETIVREKVIQAFRLNRKKQLILERINKYNRKLMEELKTPRVKASNCALMVIDFTEQTKDPLIPSIWGVTENNRFKNGHDTKNVHKLQIEDGSSKGVGGGNSGNSSSDTCCTIM